MRYLRGLVISLGLGVLGLMGTVELVLRRRDRRLAASGEGGKGQDAGALRGPPTAPVSRTLSRLRLVGGVLGLALAGYGGYLAVRTIPWSSYLAIGIWLAAAVILHDAVLVPVVSILRESLLRVGRSLSATSVALVEGAFVVGGVLSLLAVPEIWARHLGPLNPTVLPGDYGRALVLTWLVLAVVTAGAIAAIAGLARRQPAPRLGSAR